MREYNNEYKRFSLARNFRPADFITIMNGMCGTLSVLYCLDHLQSQTSVRIALVLPFLGLVFDIFDGKVARFTGTASMLGQQLDSLADLISFGVAPACLGYIFGCRTMLDKIILSFFVCCGLARLGRYNVTAHLIPKDEKNGGIKYFEGFPIPSTLFIVMLLWIYHELGWTITRTFTLLGNEAHVFVIVYFVWAICMVSSNIKIPKL